MGKATPFEGELDHAGNPCCGQSFMGGTICSLPVGHDGWCGTVCQVCDENWYDDGCACTVRCTAEDCREAVQDDEDPYCDEHGCWEAGVMDGDVVTHLCNLRRDHVGEHAYIHRATTAPSDEELAETYRSLGVVPPVQ